MCISMEFGRETGEPERGNPNVEIVFLILKHPNLPGHNSSNVVLYKEHKKKIKSQCHYPLSVPKDGIFQCYSKK